VRLDEIRRILEAEVVSGGYDGSVEAQAGCGADLLSDVLAFTHSGSLLLTGLVNPQVMVTAEVAGIVAVVFVRGKHPPPETVRRAEERGVPLMSTHYTMFEACGRLYAAGLVGCDRRSPPRAAASDRK
jgi:hypothetical protein